MSNTTSSPVVRVHACSDCFDAIEFDDHDLGYTEGTIFAHQRRMKAHCPDLSFADIHRAQSEIADEHFSTDPCDLCGTVLAGARYGFEIHP